MGTRGPAPKRSDQRRRRNKTEPVDKAPVVVQVKQPPCPRGIHPQARAWYRSLASSGQSAYYADSDWQTARIAAETLDCFFATGKVTLLREFNRMNSLLGGTDGDRRRMGLELERTSGAPTEGRPGDVADLEEARKRLYG